FARITMAWEGEFWMLGHIVLARKMVEVENGHVPGGATVLRRISFRDHERLVQDLDPEVRYDREPYFLAGALEDL
ncbi:hypothetical protein MYX64_06540, partial [Nitrospinae bacterium AH_259_B05_G02_I21]|nr:hypothetical protein [Nitrospinae bacterium AH_259_B05_G02_I21]